jgi:hypothetical protein
VEFAGNRQPCSECGKTIRLPSYISESQTPNAHSPSSSSSHQNVAGSIVLSCPICQTQLFAKTEQIGEEILCENCLESVVVEVPVEATAKAPIAQQKQPTEQPTEQPRDQVEEPTTEIAQTPLAPSLPEPTEVIEPAEEIIDLEPIDDLGGYEDYNLDPTLASPTTQQVQTISPVPTGDFELIVQWDIACQTCNTHLTVNPEDIGETLQCPCCSGPVTVDAPAKLPIPTRRRIDVTTNSGHEVNSAVTKIAPKAVKQPVAVKPEVEYELVIEWAVVCPVCNTAVAVTPEDIDSTVACPDCFKPLGIDRPNPMPTPVKRMKHGLGLELITEQPAFDLSASPNLREQIGRSPEDIDNVILEQAEKEHEKIAAAENKFEEISWLQMLLMMGTNASVLSRVAMLAIAWIVNAGILQLGAVGGDQPAGLYIFFFFSMISSLIAMAISIFAFTTLINIVRQTAYGDLEITEWPPIDFVDWFLESLIIYVAMGTAAIPAALLYVLLSAILPESMIFIPLGLAILVTAVIFPFTLLSIFENNRFYMPFSRMLQHRIMRFPELLIKFAFTSLPMIVISMLAFPVALLAENFIIKAIGITIIWVCLAIYSRNIGIYASFLARVTDEQTAP